LGSYGLTGVYGPPHPGEFTRLVHRAHDLGVTFFDTAAGYGQAETVLGRAVAPFRKQVCVCTKAAPGEAGVLTAQQLRSSCEESLHRLDTDYIDLYLIHYDAPSTPVEELVLGLEGLKKAGKIRYYGASHLPVERIAQLAERGHVSALFLELHPLSTDRLAEVSPRAGGAAIIGFSVTGRGLFTGRYGPNTQFAAGDIRRFDPLFQREQLASGLRVTERLAGLGELLDMTPAQLSTAWVLSRPGVVCALSGTSSARHLEENLGGAMRTFPPELLVEFDAFLAGESQRRLKERREHLRSLLAGETSPDLEEAKRDLIYLMEGLVSEGWAAQSQVYPLFFAMRRAQDRAALDGIHQKLRALAAGAGR
jgi:aryl-alcohol dehydrogenase-like predicted oxidoreductase